MKTQDKWKRWIDVLFAVALGIERVDFLLFNRRLLIYLHIEYSKMDSKCTVFGEMKGREQIGPSFGTHGREGVPPQDPPRLNVCHLVRVGKHSGELLMNDTSPNPYQTSVRDRYTHG